MPIGDGSSSRHRRNPSDLTHAVVNTAVQQCGQAGGNPTLAIMSGNIKNYFATRSQGGTGNPIVAQNISCRRHQPAR